MTVLLEKILDSFEWVVDFDVVNVNQQANYRKKIDNSPILFRFEE